MHNSSSLLLFGPLGPLNPQRSDAWNKDKHRAYCFVHAICYPSGNLRIHFPFPFILLTKTRLASEYAFHFGSRPLRRRQSRLLPVVQCRLKARAIQRRSFPLITGTRLLFPRGDNLASCFLVKSCLIVVRTLRYQYSL